jgi:hypothetical protein
LFGCSALFYKAWRCSARARTAGLKHGQEQRSRRVRTLPLLRHGVACSSGRWVHAQGDTTNELRGVQAAVFVGTVAALRTRARACSAVFGMHRTYRCDGYPGTAAAHALRQGDRRGPACLCAHTCPGLMSAGRGASCTAGSGSKPAHPTYRGSPCASCAKPGALSGRLLLLTTYAHTGAILLCFGLPTTGSRYAPCTTTETSKRKSARQSNAGKMDTRAGATGDRRRSRSPDVAGA